MQINFAIKGKRKGKRNYTLKSKVKLRKEKMQEIELRKEKCKVRMARERKSEEAEERKMRSLKAKLGTLKTKGDLKVPRTK